MENNVPYLISTKTLKPEFDKLEKISITSQDFSIGRGLKNSVVIPFLAISRSHCIIRKTNHDAWYIEDYSSYGIEINGVKLGRSNKKRLQHKDIICLEPSQEFIYLFIDPFQENLDNSCESPRKRIKLENSDNDIISNVKMKFEHSQSCEIKHIEDKILNAKQMQTTSMILKKQLQLEMNRKIEQLKHDYTLQIENLKGEKSAVEEQKAKLIEERDNLLTTVKKEMDGKISDLMEQVKKHHETESELIIENNLLKEKLLKEREEFLSELNRESSSKQDLLGKLEAKIREQEEIRLNEKKELEEILRQETERLKIAKEKELKELEDQKKSRELELLEELNELKKNLESKMEQAEQQKLQVEQVLNNQMEQMKKVNDEEKLKMEKLVHEREELQKKLADAQQNADKSVEELQTRVRDRETELAALAAERIQKHAEQSSEVINSLLEQLERVKSQLRSVENEKEMLKAVNESGEASTKENTLAEFTDIMENELQCSICAELFVSATTLNCSHTFCKYCITMWKKKKKACPICRASITSECKSLVLDSFIEKMVENLSEEMKQRRMNLLKSREEEVAAMMNPTTTQTSTRGGRRRRRMRNIVISASTTTIAGEDIVSSTSIPTVDLTTAPMIPSPLPVRPPVIALPATLLRSMVRSQSPQVYQILQRPGANVASSAAPRVRTTEAMAVASAVVRAATGRPAAPSNDS
ncbi:unnamed protein product [Parnassius apollo]|uniref:E3 ubiquitin-protein ligase CHFR n=1 Tax=Parnassius apollo TaxID=110799 RepID=A0A8S3WQB8_PARAO|nr:unnamed protein product [Parnassius apollo]